MRVTLPAAALLLMTGAAFAQTTTTGTTTTGTTGTTTAAPGTTMVPGSTMAAPGTTAPGAMARPGMAGAQTPGASVNTTPATTAPNPSAVQTDNTTARTAAAPVPGRNSFTMAQARRRITGAGFTAVNGLKKDNQGIWRGTAQKNGSPVSVALDYQGNVVGK